MSQFPKFPTRNQVALGIAASSGVACVAGPALAAAGVVTGDVRWAQVGGLSFVLGLILLVVAYAMFEEDE